VPDQRPLDDLSSAELHDLALRRARRHLDVAFFYHLLEVLPQAEAASGDLAKAEYDIDSLKGHLDDLTDSGKGETADLLRPFYIDYLTRHGVTTG